MKLIVALPYCSSDHEHASRLLNWIKELDPHINHHLLLVSDNAVTREVKLAIDALGKSVFSSCETIMPTCPAQVNGNYHVPAATMFLKTMAHIESCYKDWPWLWMEPDCVPLKSGWLDALASAYEESPKRYLGATMKTDGKDLPLTMFFATAIYPHNAHTELKQFCDGKKAFDVAFSDYVSLRGQSTPLIFHRFGSPTDVPTFKTVKLPTDGPNVGTLNMFPKEAVIFHRTKDGTLIDLLRQQRTETIVGPMISVGELSTVIQTVQEQGIAAGIEANFEAAPPKRGPGRPPKQHPPESVGTL